MRCLYIDGETGAAGDMILGALLDLGADADELREILRSIIPVEFTLSTEAVSISGIASLRIHVAVEEGSGHRTLAEVSALVGSGSVPAPVCSRARNVFRRLAEAEARIHSATTDTVHFHEVGANDAIIDIVGSLWMLEALGVKKVYCAPLTLGSGVGQSAHGAIHYPAPAVVEILKGIPVRMVSGLGETTTPTGAAILAEVAEFVPDLIITSERSGYGAGQRTLADRPNLLRATLGESSEVWETDQMWLAASDIDNTRPEVFAWLSDRLFAVGAVDVTMTDVAMKKGRRGVRVEALCAAAQRNTVAATILTETASLGVRWTAVTRTKLPRQIETVATPWGEIRVKVGVAPDGRKRAVPEYDDCRAAAAQSGEPLLNVIEAVGRIYENTIGGRS